MPDTPKSRGIDAVVSSPPAPLAAGWPAPLVNHSAAFSVGYYSKDGLPPTNPIVEYLPQNLTLPYLVRFPSKCTAGTNVTVSIASTVPAGGDPLEVSIGSFLPPVTITSVPMSSKKPVFVGVSALFPPLPAAALPNGLVAVHLRVPVENVKYQLAAIDVACR